MSLEKWVESGWLRAEPSSRDEIKNLLSIVARDLKDAEVAETSEDRRFEAAFNAARTAATIALRASGFRTSTQAGHHRKTIESLELTLHAGPKLVQRMEVLARKRNATSYDSAGKRLKARTPTRGENRPGLATHCAPVAADEPSGLAGGLNVNTVWHCRVPCGRNTRGPSVHRR